MEVKGMLKKAGKMIAMDAEKASTGYFSGCSFMLHQPKTPKKGIRKDYAG